LNRHANSSNSLLFGRVSSNRRNGIHNCNAKDRNRLGKSDKRLNISSVGCRKMPESGWSWRSISRTLIDLGRNSNREKQKKRSRRLRQENFLLSGELKSNRSQNRQSRCLLKHK